MELNIEEGWLCITWGVNGISMPLWFVGIVALVLATLVALVVVVFAAAMSNKPRKATRADAI